MIKNKRGLSGIISKSSKYSNWPWNSDGSHNYHRFCKYYNWSFLLRFRFHGVLLRWPGKLKPRLNLPWLISLKSFSDKTHKHTLITRSTLPSWAPEGPSGNGGLKHHRTLCQVPENPFTAGSIMVVLPPVFYVMGCSHSSHMKLENRVRINQVWHKSQTAVTDSDSFIRMFNHCLGGISHQDSLRDSIRWGGKNFIGPRSPSVCTFESEHLSSVSYQQDSPVSGARPKRTGVWSAPEFGWALTPAQSKWADEGKQAGLFECGTYKSTHGTNVGCSSFTRCKEGREATFECIFKVSRATCTFFKDHANFESVTVGPLLGGSFCKWTNYWIKLKYCGRALSHFDSVKEVTSFSLPAAQRCVAHDI